MSKKLLCKVKQNQHFNFVVEDPDPANGRIFIENQGHDINSLNPRIDQFWRWQGTNDIAEPYGTLTNWQNHPLMITNGKWCHGRMAMYARQEVWGAPGHSDPWIASLDYENYPGKHSFKTSTGLVVIGAYDTYSTTNGLMSWWIGSDMSGIPTYRIDNQSDLVTVFAEDPAVPGEFFGINYDSGTYYTGKLKTYASGLLWTTQRSINYGHTFFLGLNVDGSAMFVEMNGNNDTLEFYKYGSVGSPGLVLSDPSSNPETTHYQYPSNIRHDSATEKVFYQGEWDQHPDQELKKLRIKKYTWNPFSGTVSMVKCTLQYPAGKNHNDYQRMIRYESTWHASTRNSWFYRCHQFELNNKRYLTYLWVDSYGPNSWSERIRSYRRDKGGTWVTFEIGDGNNDYILTYHSTFDFNEIPREFPRYYMPINPSGTQLLIIRNETVSTLSFNPVQGWVEHDKENISARSAAIDSVGRIYIAACGTGTYYDTNSFDHVDGRGFDEIWLYSSTTPITINLSLPAASYTYAGTPISTTATLEAYDSSGVRIVKDVRLTITGGNLFFADGSVTKTFTTSASGTVDVELSIRGGGKPSISANVA